MKILQITPRVPPSVCGVGDYAWLLAQALRDGHDIHSSFLSAGTTWTKPEGRTEFPVFRLPELTAHALVDFMASRAGEFEAVVLHMSAYGYQKRGMPFWLAAAWRRLSRMQPGPRLVTMFHELYASGPMCSSAFWLQPLQKCVLREVARTSDRLRTNREAYADWLRLAVKDANREVPAFPVFSNMGESALRSDSSERWNGMTVFASTIQSKHLPLVSEVCSSIGIKRLGWIGTQEPPAMDLDLNIRHLRRLPTQEASSWFAEYGFAFTAYNSAFLAKSGIFATYAAYRTAVVLPSAPASLPDGLGRDRHFVGSSGLPPDGCSVESMVQIASDLHRWYLPHNLANTAASYAAQIAQ
jgi:hypothetical protein